MRRLVLLFAALLLAACADGARELKQPLKPMGDFRLGHAVVVAPNLVQGPASRKASEEEWIAAMDAALEERFRRYEGDQLYHIGVSVEGYVLARAGIPLVFNPNSVLIVRVSVLRELGIHDQPRRLLEAVDGLAMVPLEGNDVCCGLRIRKA